MFLSLVDVVCNMVTTLKGTSKLSFLLCLLLESATCVGIADSSDKCLGHMLDSTGTLRVGVVAEQAFVRRRELGGKRCFSMSCFFGKDDMSTESIFGLESSSTFIAVSIQDVADMRLINRHWQRLWQWSKSWWWHTMQEATRVRHCLQDRDISGHKLLPNL